MRDEIIEKYKKSIKRMLEKSRLDNTNRFKNNIEIFLISDLKNSKITQQEYEELVNFLQHEQEIVLKEKEEIISNENIENIENTENTDKIENIEKSKNQILEGYNIKQLEENKNIDTKKEEKPGEESVEEYKENREPIKSFKEQRKEAFKDIKVQYTPIYKGEMGKVPSKRTKEKKGEIKFTPLYKGEADKLPPSR